MLRPGFVLPPLMFSDVELEALVLGSCWVARQQDDPLARAAANAIAKIVSVLPEDLRERVESTGLLVGPSVLSQTGMLALTPFREAIRAEQKLQIVYSDGGSNQTTRIVWPIVLGFFNQSRVLAAWCEMRQSFRHFRIDRVLSVAPLSERFPRRRRALMHEWRNEQGISEQGVSLIV